ncbi:DUF4145 domain-containing protein [Micromonospora phytophila]|uniref:DUF4145 domain-containing protein n=1 Tax=Micromonospora phytophila TaxID=709888 RepID=UPI00202E4D9D|nr:DUF4145 domain-containing protein [Micromonospora phytophila]
MLAATAGRKRIANPCLATVEVVEDPIETSDLSCVVLLGYGGPRRWEAYVRFAEVGYRDCPWCKTRNIALNVQWSRVEQADSGKQRFWGVFTCPRCAGAVLVEVKPATGANLTSYSEINRGLNVFVMKQVPEDGNRAHEIAHLPEDVEGFFRDAEVVLGAGVPDAAAVQLRKTLEAAAAHKGIRERTLVQSIQKLIEDGAVTVDFSEVLHYVRKLGNLGAHFTDEKLTEDDVQRALRFTAQLLRNLFEVPGELELLKTASEEADAGTE